MTDDRELTMLLVGDIYVQRDDPPSVFQHVAGLLRGADFTFGNLESAIADRGTLWSRSTTAPYKADARQIAAIEAGGFDALTIANNHVLDFGHDAFLETLEHLQRIGVKHAGGGRNSSEAHAPAIIERGACRVALLGYTSVFMENFVAGKDSPGVAVMRARTSYEPPDRFFEAPGTPPKIRTWIVPEDKAQLSADIAAARTQADIVVCTFHWGISQGFQRLTEYQVELGHCAIDAGADIVFGHHPHVLQGIEVYKGRAIFYSLGNFTFASHYKFADFFELDTIVVRCRIRNKSIAAVEFLPARCDAKLDPHVLDVVDGRGIVDLIKKRSTHFSTQFIVDRDAMRVAT